HPDPAHHRLTAHTIRRLDDQMIEGGPKMHHTRVWTIEAQMPAATLQLLATEALGYQPGVTAGAWASVSRLGDTKRPPERMCELRERLAARGIQHSLY